MFHLVLIYSNVLEANFTIAFKLDIVLLFIFVMGTLIIAPGLKKNPENFVGRFMILTTIQLLAVLSVLLAITYVKIPNVKIVSFHIISVFVLLMFFQSFLLINEANKSN